MITGIIFLCFHVIDFLFTIRFPWVTVRHECIGPRSYRVSPVTLVQDVKQLIYEETNLPVKEQRLLHNGRIVSCFFCDWSFNKELLSLLVFRSLIIEDYTPTIVLLIQIRQQLVFPKLCSSVTCYKKDCTQGKKKTEIHSPQ